MPGDLYTARDDAQPAVAAWSLSALTPAHLLPRNPPLLTAPTSLHYPVHPGYLTHVPRRSKSFSLSIVRRPVGHFTRAEAVTPFRPSPSHTISSRPPQPFLPRRSFLFHAICSTVRHPFRSHAPGVTGTRLAASRCFALIARSRIRWISASCCGVCARLANIGT